MHIYRIFFDVLQECHTYKYNMDIEVSALPLNPFFSIYLFIQDMLKTLLNSTITADMSVNDSIWVKPTLLSVTLKFMQPYLIFLENIYALIKCLIFFQHTTIRSTSYHKKDSYLEYFQKQLDGAKSYKAWSQAAMALDNLTGANEWKNSPVSDDYDYQLLQSRINEVNYIRSSGQDRRAMTFALRLSLSRNLGDLGNSAVSVLYCSNFTC